MSNSNQDGKVYQVLVTSWMHGIGVCMQVLSFTDAATASAVAAELLKAGYGDGFHRFVELLF